MTTERYDKGVLDVDLRSIRIHNEQIHSRVTDVLAQATMRVTGQWIEADQNFWQNHSNYIATLDPTQASAYMAAILAEAEQIQDERLQIDQEELNRKSKLGAGAAQLLGKLLGRIV